MPIAPGPKLDTAQSQPRGRNWLPRRLCVAHLVREAGTRAPDALALSSGAETMSYGEMIGRASRLATYLISLGVGPDVPVALCFERSFDLITSALAVLMAGGAYLPLDPKWPAERLNTILEDAAAPFVVARGRLALRGGDAGPQVLDLELQDDAIGSFARLEEPVSVTREQLAYIIYTSGSTGKPKGVEVTHGNLLNLIFWHRRFFDVTAEDRASHLAGVAFDASVWEIWPHLTAGATLVLAEEPVRTSPELLRAWVVKQKITIAFVPTVLAEPMLAEPWPAGTALRYLLTGGDTLHRSPSPDFPVAVINNYGPTECTVVASSGTVNASGGERQPTIGSPIAHTEIYVLDSERKPVASGEIGELYIAGPSVARGYRNAPEATEERFLPNPFSAIAGARMYRTGDLGYFLPNGEIAFCGRADIQEEIRGYRIEPNEIVSALNGHPGVVASAVMARGIGCKKSLVGYVVPREEAGLSAPELRDFLAARLPEYMVPASFVRMGALPLNFNGKLDRQALPDPSPDNLVPDTAYRAPSTPTEEQLVAILSTLLKIDRLGIDDNFFFLGVHSLLATQVAARVYERFGVQLTPRHLFESKTIARLAVEVDRQLEARLASMSDEEVARLLAH